MKPFIFEFKEVPTGDTIDYSIVEYDDTLNLSVHKVSKQPAIEMLSMQTETFTKTQGEGADTDKSALTLQMDTETGTYTRTETSDSDKDRRHLQMLIDTSTLTERTESTDQDTQNVTHHYPQN